MRKAKRECILYPVSIIGIVVFLTMSIALGEHYAWNCPNCGRTGNTGNYCGSCAHPAPWISGSNNEPLPETNTILPSINPVEVGSIVCFGNYEQDSNTANGKEPIEWLVLDYDATNNHALLLSRYGLDVKPYNTVAFDKTWANCTLRAWLNIDFVYNAFSAVEQKSILTTSVDNSESQGCSEWSTIGGNNTQDKVFLLSCAEANKYLGVTQVYSSNITSRAVPTAYTLSKGAYTYIDFASVEKAATGWWWLRSPGRYQSFASYVNYAGSLSSASVSNGTGCVRPALWINLESNAF